MKLLLDAHVLLWLIFDRSRLSLLALRLLEDSDNELFLSRATIWELANKVAAGRLPMPGSSIRYLLDQIERIGIVVLPIEMDDILRTETLPHHHGDPFDRMIVAQAVERGLTTLTKDEDIHSYPVTCLWK